jgi:formate-dependent phosphoribosylglycinamide formyltransferase (GAR transformylase)
MQMMAAGMATFPLQLTPDRQPVESVAGRGGFHPSADMEASIAAMARILVITTCHLPSTARLAMECAQVGAEVTLLSPADHPARVTKSVSHRMTYRALRPIQALREAITSAKPDIVIPCDERAVRHLHRLHALTPSGPIRAVIERSIGPADSYPITAARNELLDLARRAGVTAPHSVTVGGVSDLRVWGETQPFPWVLKADGSWAGFGVRIVHSMEEAEAAYHAMVRPASARLAIREALLERDLFWIAPWIKRTRPTMSVQAYIDGWPANCAVACWKGEVIGEVCAESVTTESATGPSTVASIISNPQMVESARSVVRTLGISGLVGFDFMIEGGSGVPYMIEMNPRVTPIAPLRFGPGRDLVEALVARCTGRPVRNRPRVTERNLVVFFPHTWQQDPASPYLHTAYHDVPWEEPALVRLLIRPELRERYWIMRLLRRAWLKVRRDAIRYSP